MTADQIMALAMNAGHENTWDALRAAVEQLCRDRDEWKSAANAATELARHNHERVERAERENALLGSAIDKARSNEREQWERAERYRCALEMIAGKRQCVDNLMSNAEIASAALEGK